MFDDDELEQIREDRGDWQGHIDRQKVKKSRTSTRIFAGSAAASFVAVGFLVFLVLSGMMGSALVGLAGLGGFSADIEELVGNDVSIYPAIGPTAACPSTFTGGDYVEGGGQDGNEVLENGNDVATVPQLRADISNATVPVGSNLTLNKDIQVPEILSLSMIRVSIRQDPSLGEVGNVTLGNTSLYVTGLTASRLTAFDTKIGEYYTDGTTSNPKFGSTGEFVLEGTSGTDNQVQIINASGRAHFLSFEELTLPNLDLAIEYYNSSSVPSDAVISENNTGFTNCPAASGGTTDNPF